MQSFYKHETEEGIQFHSSGSSSGVPLCLVRGAVENVHGNCCTERGEVLCIWILDITSRGKYALMHWGYKYVVCEIWMQFSQS